MLALTPTAAEAIQTIVNQSDAPEGAVLRITSEEAGGDEGAEVRDLQLAVVESPEEEDLQVQGLPVSVEPDTIDFLDDKVLDAEVDEGNVKFSLYLQPPGDPSDQITDAPNGSRPTD